ncbi:MAG TPA: response regulator [Pirellulales bacterium]|nr:response regulator [Pirellulales bacterium]
MSTITVSSRCNSPTDQSIVFIVDDDPDVRHAIAVLMSTINLPTKSFASAQDFLDAVDERQSGCVVLDVRIPGMTGLQLQQRLVERGSTLPIIFISGESELATAVSAMRAGAIDFIAKPFSMQQLLDRAQEAVQLDRRRRSMQRQRQEMQDRVATLTARQREVMQLLAQGESTKSIARRLGISQKTVDNHRAKVLEKMSAENAAQLAAEFSHFQTPER